MSILDDISQKLSFKTWVRVAVLGIILLGLFGFSSSKQGEMRVKKSEIFVEQAYDNYFIDEKDVVNKNVYGNRVRADPPTGCVRRIFVNGSFRQSYNLISFD